VASHRAGHPGIGHFHDIAVEDLAWIAAFGLAQPKQR